MIDFLLFRLTDDQRPKEFLREIHQPSVPQPQEFHPTVTVTVTQKTVGGASCPSDTTSTEAATGGNFSSK